MTTQTDNLYIVYTEGGYEQSFETQTKTFADVQRLALIGITATWFKVQNEN